MEYDEQLQERIHEYLRGDMSKEDRRSFAQAIDKDEALQQLVKKEKFKREGLQFMLAQQLRDKMRDWEAEEPTATAPSPSPLPSLLKRWWWLGVLILGLLIFFLWPKEPETSSTVVDPDRPIAEETDQPFTENENQTTAMVDSSVQAPFTIPERPTSRQNETIAQREKSEPTSKDYELIAMANYQAPDHFNIQNKGVVALDTSPLSQGIAVYKEQQYTDAIAILLPLADTSQTAEEYLAHAYLANGNFENAVVIFQEILARKPGVTVYETTQWYLLLSLLPNYPAEENKIRSLLGEILSPENDHFFQQEAQALEAELQLFK